MVYCSEVTLTVLFLHFYFRVGGMQGTFMNVSLMKAKSLLPRKDKKTQEMNQSGQYPWTEVTINRSDLFVLGG